MSDLIDRQAAIDEVKHYIEIGYDSDIIHTLENLPSAQPERKKGKWIKHILKNANVPWGFDCSVCDEWFVIGDDTAERYYFCPNCGADMRGE